MREIGEQTSSVSDRGHQIDYHSAVDVVVPFLYFLLDDPLITFDVTLRSLAEFSMKNEFVPGYTDCVGRFVQILEAHAIVFLRYEM